MAIFYPVRTIVMNGPRIAVDGYSSGDLGMVYYFSVTSEKVNADHIEIRTKADHSRD